MHEMSICESILQTLEEQAIAQHFSKVLTLRLEIGALSCVEPQALQFSFDVISHGTLAEGASLDIIERPGLGWCKQCEKNVVMQQRYDSCPHCELAPLPLISGDELNIKELEVE